MNVANAGPTRQASLSSRSRERPGMVDSTPRPGSGDRAAGALRGVMDVTQAGDPDPAIDRLQIEDKVGTVAAVGIPPFEVSAADRARRGIVVARPLRLQRRAPPHPLGAALLTRLAPGRWERRWGGLR